MLVQTSEGRTDLREQVRDEILVPAEVGVEGEKRSGAAKPAIADLERAGLLDDEVGIADGEDGRRAQTAGNSLRRAERFEAG